MTRKMPGTQDESRSEGTVDLVVEHERIAKRAYALYEARGRADGHALDDWLQAAEEDAASREHGTHYGASASLAERVRQHG